MSHMEKKPSRFLFSTSSTSNSRLPSASAPASTIVISFPVYALTYHAGSGIVVVGGGGGPSRSGLRNGFNLLALREAQTGRWTLEPAGELFTGDEAVMCCSLYDDKTDCWVVAGVNDRCWLLELVRDGSRQTSLALLRTVQGDSSPSDDGYLRVARIAPEGRTFLAAGCESRTREWGLPEMRLHRTISHDATDVVDADLDATRILTATGRTLFVDRKTDEGVERMFAFAPTAGCVFKCARLVVSRNAVLAVENTTGSKRKCPRVILFSLKTGRRLQQRTLNVNRNCTCLSVADDDQQCALGFSDGSLLVLQLDDLALVRLQRKEAHPFPVTGLAIDTQKRILISSSADGVVMVSALLAHPVRVSRLVPWMFLLLALFVLLAAALLRLDGKVLERAWTWIGSWRGVVDEAADFDAFYTAVRDQFRDNGQF